CHLPQPVVSGRIVLIQLQRGTETLRRLVQTVQLEKDVAEVYECRDVVRSQCQRESIAVNRIIETSVLLVQLAKQIDPAKLFWREAIRVQVRVAGRGRE